MTRLQVTTDAPPRRSKTDSRVTQLRAAVIGACEGRLTEEEMRWVNFRPPPPFYQLPKVLYAQPIAGKRFFEIYAYGEDGPELLSRVGSALREEGSVRVGQDRIGITGFEVDGPAPWAPRPAGTRLRYRNVTPMVLFDKPKERSTLIAIEKKYRESDPGRYEEETKRVIADLVRQSIGWQVRQRLGVEDASFAKRIGIEVERFRFTWRKYHADKPVTAFLHMTFASDWLLPRFLGHHTGKGYGQIKAFGPEGGER